MKKKSRRRKKEKKKKKKKKRKEKKEKREAIQGFLGILRRKEGTLKLIYTQVGCGANIFTPWAFSNRVPGSS